MTATTIRVQMAQRKDTAANWTAANPILLSGEIGYETDTKKFKIGDGTTNWNSLAYLPIPDGSGNLTITGNLEIGTTGSLTFEGSTANGFETTLAVTDPTADRTITLPNVSGTIITTGDTGSVTSTMLLDGTIVNADISDIAEIAVSKLANGTANQVIVTDGTNVSWSDNLTLAGDLIVNGITTTINTQELLVEDKNIIIGNVTSPTDVTADGGGITLKGTTDKTINWVDSTDAWTSSERFSYPLGSATAPALTFTGDPNTGIYSPGADQVAISTNGTGRLIVGSTGTVNIVGAGTAGSTQAVSFNGSAPVNSLVMLSDGKIGLGTSSPAQLLETQDGNIQIRNSVTLSENTLSPYGLTFRNANQLGQDRGTIAEIKPYLAGAGDNDFGLQFRTQATTAGGVTTKMTLTPGGSLGIGTTSPGTDLDVNNSGANCVIRARSGSTYSATLSLLPNGSGSGVSLAAGEDSSALLYNQLNSHLAFGTNNTERARIDGSGRLLVGTSSTSSTAGLIVQGAGGAAPGIIRACYTAATPADGDTFGYLVFGDSAHADAAWVAAARDGGTWSGASKPTRLVFSTTADGASSPTERMRITQDGDVFINHNSSTSPVVGGEKLGVVGGSNFAIAASTTTNTVPTVFLANTSDTTNTYLMRFSAGSGGNTRGEIYYNGSQLVYATSSDYRLKENVQPLLGGIELVNRLRPVTYQWIENQNHDIGFIAHEVQEVFPNAVGGDKDAVDENGKILPQTYDPSKLVPLLTAALQEAIGRIETLEAEVTALKAS